MSVGMVELVASSDTLRKIQVEYGVTGSFKDKPLAEWLRKYNPAEDEYDKVKTPYCHRPAQIRLPLIIWFIIL